MDPREDHMFGLEITTCGFWTTSAAKHGFFLHSNWLIEHVASTIQAAFVSELRTNGGRTIAWLGCLPIGA